MPDSAYLETYQRRLVELGFPAARLRRQVQELADHHEDLRQAAREEGLSEAEAEIRAGEWLGEPSSLAENAVCVLRQSSWWWRHRFVAFGLLPVLAIVAWIVSGLILGYLAGKCLLPAARAKAMADGGSGFGLLVIGVQGVYYSAIVVTSILFCRLALRSPAGLVWAMISCAVCAGYCLFGYVDIKPHNLFLGFASIPTWPHLLFAAIPLAVAAGASVQHRRLSRRLAPDSSGDGHSCLSRRAAICLLGGLGLSFAGCASTPEKPAPARGWIGGEYRVARQPTFWRQVFPREDQIGDPAFNTNAGYAFQAAVKLTALGTNTPAHRAGLCEGDLILELNRQPVTRLKDFNRTVDRSEPGTLLPVKLLRNGQTMDFNVPVGRETYRREGLLAFALPSIVRPWDLWPDPGFSLVFLGFHKNPGVRHELGRQREISERDWNAWLVVFEVAGGQRILSQNCVAPPARSNAPESATGPAAR